MTGVRSFDVKAYDNALANYADLGWGDDLRLYLPYSERHRSVLPPTSATPADRHRRHCTVRRRYRLAAGQSIQTRHVDLHHPEHVRARGADAAAGRRTTGSTPSIRTPTLPDRHELHRRNTATTQLLGNIGDDTRDRPAAAGLGLVVDRVQPGAGHGRGSPATGGFPVGPPFSPPIYPSYPPPYPAPLRGIQIQIRVADPTNQRIKSLTIRQDFTDKL